jgi:DNA-binding NarL/FixJ family response regulator
MSSAGHAYHLNRIPVVIGVEGLTPTQKRVLNLRCTRDMTVAEVAQELHVSVQTVKNHNSAILHRTGYHSMNGVCYVLGQAHGAAVGYEAIRPEQV